MKLIDEVQRLELVSYLSVFCFFHFVVAVIF